MDNNILREEFLNHKELAGLHGYCNPIMANKIADYWIAKMDLQNKEFEQSLDTLHKKHQLELKELVDKIIKLSDDIEVSIFDSPVEGLRAFKRFRNTLRDNYLK